MPAACLEHFFRKQSIFKQSGVGFHKADNAWQRMSESVGHGLAFPDEVAYQRQCGSLCIATTAAPVLRMQALWKDAMASLVTRASQSRPGPAPSVSSACSVCPPLCPPHIPPLTSGFPMALPNFRMIAPFKLGQVPVDGRPVAFHRLASGPLFFEKVAS